MKSKEFRLSNCECDKCNNNLSIYRDNKGILIAIHKSSYLQEMNGFFISNERLKEVLEGLKHILLEEFNEVFGVEK